MARPHPSIITSNPITRRLVEDFELKYCPENGLDGEERSIKREYWKHGKRTLVRLLAQSVLSGEWNMGTTQTDVGENLGLDHSCLSDARWKGEMSGDILVAILFSDERPDEPWPTSHVVDSMNRSGFIAAAKHFARLVRDRDNLKPDGLNELQYELMGEMWARSRMWSAAVLNKTTGIAVEIVRHVCVETKRDVVPVWYRKDQAAETQDEIKKLLGNEKAAFEHLSMLHKNWADIFAVTVFSTEIGVRYSYKG